VSGPDLRRRAFQTAALATLAGCASAPTPPDGAAAPADTADPAAAAGGPAPAPVPVPPPAVEFRAALGAVAMKAVMGVGAPS
jgi:hypothetical protein